MRVVPRLRISIPTHLYRRQRRRHEKTGASVFFTSVGLLGWLGMLLLSLVLAVPAEAQGRAPGGNFSDPAIRAVDIAQPSVVRIGTVYQGSITLEVCGQSYSLPGDGNAATIAGLGTGTFISSNGDILTADHVVSIDKPDLDSAIVQILANDIANLLNANASCLNLGGVVTPDQITYQSLVNSGIAFSTSYGAPQHIVWLDVGYTGPDSNGEKAATDPLSALMQASHMSATIVAESQFTADDVAILHVDMPDSPGLILDNSNNVAVQDHLTEIGFPGNGDASHPDNTYDTTDLVTPTVDSLNVVSLKSNDDGSGLIQVSGALEHGDSGGPALDTAGNVVGIVSYSATDTPIGSFFLRSSNSARALVSTAGISTSPGTFETLWRQAFNDYASDGSGHWHTAARELDALSARYPGFGGVLPFKDYADQAELSEFALGGVSQRLVAFISLVTALAALAALLIITVVTRARRRRQKAAIAVAAPYPAPVGSYSSFGPSVYRGYDGYGDYGPPRSAASGVEPVSGWPSRLPGGELERTGGAPQGMQNFNSAGRLGLNVCANGHPMDPTEVYCHICGMPRAVTPPPQPVSE